MPHRSCPPHRAACSCPSCPLLRHLLRHHLGRGRRTLLRWRLGQLAAARRRRRARLPVALSDTAGARGMLAAEYLGGACCRLSGGAAGRLAHLVRVGGGAARSTVTRPTVQRRWLPQAARARIWHAIRHAQGHSCSAHATTRAASQPASRRAREGVTEGAREDHSQAPFKVSGAAGGGLRRWAGRPPADGAGHWRANQDGRGDAIGYWVAVPRGLHPLRPNRRRRRRLPPSECSSAGGCHGLSLTHLLAPEGAPVHRLGTRCSRAARRRRHAAPGALCSPWW
jgi:hypothetical protein